MDTFSLYISNLKHFSDQIYLGPNKTLPIPSLEIIKLFETNLGLTFIIQKEEEGNVCLANNSEVRPEFKETFTSRDLFDYFYAILHSSAYGEKWNENSETSFNDIPIQTDNAKFWELVQSGRELQKKHLIKNEKLDI